MAKKKVIKRPPVKLNDLSKEDRDKLSEEIRKTMERDFNKKIADAKAEIQNQLIPKTDLKTVKEHEKSSETGTIRSA